MRKVLACAALGLALSVSLAPAANAQGGGGGRGQGRGGFGQGRGGFGGGLMLLNIKEVQTELKMTEPQVAKIAEKQQDMFAKMQELRPGGGGGERPSPEEMQAMMTKIQELQSKAVTDILDTTQMKRFKQLEIQQAVQMSPAAAINRKDIADALKITEAQKTQIQGIQTKQREEQRATFQGVDFQNMSQEERQAMFRKMQDSQKATGDKMLAVLTDAQKKQLKDMQGEPFKFPAQQGFGGRGPGGGRPGGAGGNPPPPPAV